MSNLVHVSKTYALPIVLGIASVCSIVVAIALLVRSTPSSSPIQFSSDSATQSAVLGESLVSIDIEGAVARPGVYSLPGGSRVEDAVRAAGGFTTEADTETIALTINRAMKLVDGAKLYIPKKGSNVNLQESQAPGLISVNRASQNELETLPGVGPVTAQKIIDNRPYQTLEELVTKKAVGQALFDKVKNLVSL